MTSLCSYPCRLHLNSNCSGSPRPVSRRGAHGNHSHTSVCFGNKRYRNEIDGTGSSRADVSCINGKRDSVLGNTARLFTAGSFTVRRRSALPPYTHARHTHAGKTHHNSDLCSLQRTKCSFQIHTRIVVATAVRSANAQVF